MEQINRGTGITETERYLARLADSTFLELWAYPNTFIDKRSTPGGTGKELADLLVVCGDDVIIFSDKSINCRRETTCIYVGHVGIGGRWRNQLTKFVGQNDGCANIQIAYFLTLPARKNCRSICRL
jgi:hypothetical protein